jgi:hypothetical protein
MTAQIVRAQVPQVPGAPVVESRPPAGRPVAGANLPQLDLDFPGGNPRALIAAVQEALHKPLNVIIPADGNSVQIEPMKLTGVTVPDLFEAISAASHRMVTVNGNNWNTEYTFRNHGTMENPIWVFDAGRPAPDQNICRFYQLGQELKTYSIEDITTAVQIGWKMLGVKDIPLLRFHSETKLLIAVGPPALLQTIDSVLSELRKAPQDSEPRKNKEIGPTAK